MREQVRAAWRLKTRPKVLSLVRSYVVMDLFQSNTVYSKYRLDYIQAFTVMLGKALLRGQLKVFGK